MTDASKKLISTNSTAGADYFLQEFVEAGIVLVGTEIKSIRNQTPNLKDSFVEISTRKSNGVVRSLEAWLVNLHIGPYSHGNIWNHEPRRRRKLLMHTHQIKQLFEAQTQDGKALVPVRMYYLNGRVKVEVAVAKGKKRHDKRSDAKKRDQDREIDQALKSSRKARTE